MLCNKIKEHEVAYTPTISKAAQFCDQIRFQETNPIKDFKYIYQAIGCGLNVTLLYISVLVALCAYDSIDNDNSSTKLKVLWVSITSLCFGILFRSIISLRMPIAAGMIKWTRIPENGRFEFSQVMVTRRSFGGYLWSHLVTRVPLTNCNRDDSISSNEGYLRESLLPHIDEYDRRYWFKTLLVDSVQLFQKLMEVIMSILIRISQVCCLVVLNVAVAVVFTEMCMLFNEGAWLWYAFETGVYNEFSKCRYVTTLWLQEEFRVDTVVRAYFASNHHLLFLIPWCVITIFWGMDIFRLVSAYCVQYRKFSRYEACEAPSGDFEEGNEQPLPICEDDTRKICGSCVTNNYVAMFVVWTILPTTVYVIHRAFDQQQW